PNAKRLRKRKPNRTICRCEPHWHVAWDKLFVWKIAFATANPICFVRAGLAFGKKTSHFDRSKAKWRNLLPLQHRIAGMLRPEILRDVSALLDMTVEQRTQFCADCTGIYQQLRF